MQDFNWKSTIRVNIFFLKIVGLWPEGNNYQLNFYSAYSAITMLIFLLGHNLLQTVNLFFIYNNLEALTASIFVSMTQCLAILKAYYIIQNMNILKELMEKLSSEMFQPKDKQQQKLVEPNLESWSFIYKVLWGNACCTLLLWTIFPIMDHSIQEYRLPFLVWYPYNTKKSPSYEFTYIYQMLCCYIICIINIGVDSLIAALNMYISAQCEILSDNLRRICDYNYQEKFQKCCTHHKEILKFSQNSQLFFNWIVLLQFFTSAISIAFTMFQLTVVTPFSSQFYSFLFYLNAVTLEIFMYCWFGNQVEVKSGEIFYAIFESSWTSTSQETKRKVLFFSLRCATPIRMSALNLFYLSLETFVKILRTAWSYFAVLHQVNSRQN